MAAAADLPDPRKDDVWNKIKTHFPIAAMQPFPDGDISGAEKAKMEPTILERPNPRWTTDFKEQREEIGQGNFGTVYKVTDTAEGKHHAAKFLYYNDLYENFGPLKADLKLDELIKNYTIGARLGLPQIVTLNRLPHKIAGVKNTIRKEVAMMQMFQGPLYVPFRSAYEPVEGAVVLVMGMAADKDLKDEMTRRQRHKLTFSERETRNIIKQMLQALAGMHAQSPAVLHLDIKPDNVLLGTVPKDPAPRVAGARYDMEHEDVRLWLSDFGLSERDGFKGASGTPGYFAPETVDKGLAASPKADVFSTGIVFYMCMFGWNPFKKPFKLMHYPQDMSKVLRPDHEGQKLDPTGFALLKRMLAEEAADRPTAAQALDDLWFKSKAENNPACTRTDPDQPHGTVRSRVVGVEEVVEAAQQRSTAASEEKSEPIPFTHEATDVRPGGDHSMQFGAGYDSDDSYGARRGGDYSDSDSDSDDSYGGRYSSRRHRRRRRRRHHHRRHRRRQRGRIVGRIEKVQLLGPDNFVMCREHAFQAVQHHAEQQDRPQVYADHEALLDERHKLRQQVANVARLIRQAEDALTGWV